MPLVKVSARGKNIAVRLELNQASLKLLRSTPNQQGWKGSDLIVEPTPAALDYISKTWPDAKWDEEAQNFRNIAKKIYDARPVHAPQVYIPKTAFMEKQKIAFEMSKGLEYFANFMEQGTGKTKVTLDDVAWSYQHGLITGFLIIAPNGVHTNWIKEEIPKHLPDWCNANLATWDARKGRKNIAHLYDQQKGPRLSILAVNVEALSTAKGEAICKEFLLAFPSLCAIDEATVIKTPGSKRTKAALRLAAYMPLRRTLTGTPITKGPLDHYAPMSFLHESILGHSSFYTFRARYAVMKPLPGKKDSRGRQIEIPVAWQNLEELSAKVKKHSYRVLKSECFDLPPKLYQRRFVEMTKEQWALYYQMATEKEIVIGDRHITAPLAMVQQMRLAQIASGYLPNADPDGPAERIPGGNPRLEALLDDLERLEDATGKVLIFAPWTRALQDIYSGMKERFGTKKFVVMSRKQSMTERDAAKKMFQENDEVRFFLLQSDLGSRGHTLTAAAYVQYYCQRYDYEVRAQSEDRPHRYGQINPVLYTDYEAIYEENFTTDRDVIENLKAKREIADLINGDNPPTHEWMAEKMAEIDKNFYKKYESKKLGEYV